MCFLFNVGELYLRCISETNPSVCEGDQENLDVWKGASKLSRNNCRTGTGRQDAELRLENQGKRESEVK